jgi:hypothetical protein
MVARTGLYVILHLLCLSVICYFHPVMRYYVEFPLLFLFLLRTVQLKFFSTVKVFIMHGFLHTVLRFTAENGTSEHSLHQLQIMYNQHFTIFQCINISVINAERVKISRVGQIIT